VEKKGLREALIEAGVRPQTPFGFADEMRVGLRGMVRRAWGRRGVKVRQRLQLVYEWRYLFLVVDGLRGKLDWTWIESMKSEMVGAAVNGLKEHTEVAAVVWDGAKSHRSELVHGVGLPLISLPSYSPELNPAERVFEEIRRWIEGKVYGSIKDKVEAVDAYLTSLESKPHRVKALAGWDWIHQAVQSCPVIIAA